MNFSVRKLFNAARTKLKGATVPTKAAVSARNYTPIERPITYDVVTAAASIHKISSSMSQIANLAFRGFDPIITAPESEDKEVAKKRCAEALEHWQQVNDKIGDVGMMGNVGTLGLIRRSFFDTAIYRKALFEFRMSSVGGWYDPTEIQWIPSKTLNRAPAEVSGNDRYITDVLLPGVVYDRTDRKTRFYQSIDSTNKAVLESENCVYIEDMLLAEGLSILANLMPSVREWLTLRRNLMLVSHEAGTPKQVLSFEPPPAESELDFDVDSLTTLAEEILQAGPEENAFLLPVGLRMDFPSVPIPVNPQDPDSYIRDEIRDHFFPKDWFEQSSQAISSTSNPLKVLMDMMLGGHRETNGVPWERFWTQWLQDNGYKGYKFTFDWWDLAPKDQLAERAQDRSDVIAGIMTDDEARANRDPPLPPLTPEQRAQIAAKKGAKPPLRVQNVPPEGEETPPMEPKPVEEEPEEIDLSKIDLPVLQRAVSDRILQYKCPENPPGSGNFKCPDTKTGAETPKEADARIAKEHQDYVKADNKKQRPPERDPGEAPAPTKAIKAEISKVAAVIKAGKVNEHGVNESKMVVDDYITRSSTLTTLILDNPDIGKEWQDPDDTNNSRISVERMYNNRVLALDQMMEKCVVDTPHTVYTGVADTWDKLPKDVGDEFQLQTFRSTSRDFNIARSFSQNREALTQEISSKSYAGKKNIEGIPARVIEIKLNKGTKAMHLEEFAEERHAKMTSVVGSGGVFGAEGNQLEVLIARKQTYRVTGYRKETRYGQEDYILEVETVV